MSDWYWRVLALKAAFVIICLTSYLTADDTIQKLPFCNPNTATQTTVINDIVIVSTLDGRVTAFETNSGVKTWDLQTQPLLASNLHHVELTAGGKWVRLVPSLRGTLYSLSGDTIEPLPFNAEQLLSSSFKYSEDLVIAGARESLWIGVDAQSGGVIYQCGSQGCTNDQETAGADQEVLVLRRNSNVVRALEPRSGTEKWNFSVAEHQLALSNSRECMGADGEGSLADDYIVAVALPEGIIALQNVDTNIMKWSHKLEAPIAGTWRLRGGALRRVDVLWAAARALGAEPHAQAAPPALYVGLHDQQLYVQEGLMYVQKMETAVSAKPMPWKLQQTRPLITGPGVAHDALSLVALYGNNGQAGNHGFFLYSEESCEQAVQVAAAPEGPDAAEPEGPDAAEPEGPDAAEPEGPDVASPGAAADHAHHVHVHVYSLWHWWKEVIVIAISSALLMNLMIWPRFIAPRVRPSTPLPVNQEYIVVERHYERPVNGAEYCGRYESDFTPLRCLGRGGFGVVFEARNNIDHCSYAVKRITLPRRESKRERVLREVRALAKLEHENIVRYFNSWLEEPPPNWQEQRDAVWIRELDGVSLEITEDCLSSSPKPTQDHPSSLTTKSLEKPNNVMLNLQKTDIGGIDACLDALEYDKHLAEGSKRHRSLSCNDSFSIVFEDNVTKDDSSGGTLKTSPHTPNATGDGSAHRPTDSYVGGDNDDSFIVFANTEDLNHNSKGLSEARNDGSFDKRLDKVKACEPSERSTPKKKKGHTRHWSLDMVVKGTSAGGGRGGGGSKMYLYIQMQLCLQESLHDWLRNNRTYEARGHKVKGLFSQIVSAVEYVHLAGLIHRDLKPSNIFFAPDGKVKVGDFGLVTTMWDSSQDSEETMSGMNVQTRHTYRVGTRLYMSPEQLRGLSYGYKVDIYSLGLILFELLQPFNTDSERVACLMGLREGKFPRSFGDNFSNEMAVLKLMLSEEPRWRPTAAGVRARAPLYQRTDERWHFAMPAPALQA